MSEGQVEYTLAELAAATGVAPRTIRYYQSEGVLPKPRRRGRDAVYDDSHRSRLRLVAQLQGRGLSLATIRELLDRRARRGVSIGDWLDLDDALRGPWSDDHPIVVGAAELHELIGARPPDFVARLERSGYLERQPRGDRWRVPSPALLEDALRLHDAGIDVEVSGEARDLLRRRLSRAVDDVIKLFVQHMGTGFTDHATEAELGRALAALRETAGGSAATILTQEIERGLRAMLGERGGHDRPRTPGVRGPSRG